uniref:Zinc finger MYM-type protein 1 n=1 Tax=Cajanus cajan TaxID=3821 RepID=A0A151TRL3_CAJCA|nr:Zinc finger MYM-type protein 1 [Cajanus cajan]
MCRILIKLSKIDYVSRALLIQFDGSHLCFRGHDESPNSKNRGNFLEMIKLLASHNDELAKVVLENAPYNSKYTYHQIQKEILHIMASKVRSYVREEIGDSKFCIIVDESQREQIAIVLRFVDKSGCIQEQFFDLMHVKDTTTITLKKEVWEWNVLQALFLKDCPYAYYIDCFAHRLQLALVAASREVIIVHQFFSNLNFVVNIICSSSKNHDELHAAKLDEITHLLEIDELEIGKDMYDATCVVLQKIIVDGSTYSVMTSFEFILILHLMKKMMGNTDCLCHALQQKSLDILNVMK